jgi:hypothetical protein
MPRLKKSQAIKSGDLGGQNAASVNKITRKNSGCCTHFPSSCSQNCRRKSSSGYKACTFCTWYGWRPCSFKVRHTTTMTESVGNETIEKYRCFLSRNWHWPDFLPRDDIKNMFGYATYVTNRFSHSWPHRIWCETRTWIRWERSLLRSSVPGWNLPVSFNRCTVEVNNPLWKLFPIALEPHHIR